MPYCCVRTNVALADDKSTEVARYLSRLLANLLEKSEDYVMVELCDGRNLMMGGSSDPAAMVQLVSLGLQAASCAELSGRLCQFLERELAIYPERVYIAFADHDRAMMGWNGKTFG